MSEKMMAKQARQFEHGYSTIHAAILAKASLEHGCQCEAYQDWFTYPRWQAQSMQVQRGEHGVKLFKFGTYTNKKTGKVKKGPIRFVVFCRCQVKEI